MTTLHDDQKKQQNQQKSVFYLLADTDGTQIGGASFRMRTLHGLQRDEMHKEKSDDIKWEFTGSQWVNNSGRMMLAIASQC